MRLVDEYSQVVITGPVLVIITFLLLKTNKTHGKSAIPKIHSFNDNVKKTRNLCIR